MKRILISAAALLSIAALSPREAEARFFDSALQAPNGVEQAQMVVRERIVRPGYPGYRRGWHRDRFDRCRVVRERIERPNGRVVIRTRRICR